jgi:outer membrane protein assembly factor BamB/adenine/guanine phosphoribosyltransferase-like PRPP-binding protein
VLLDRALVTAIADAFWTCFADRDRFQLATLETAGIPLMTAIQLRAPESHRDIGAVIIRKSRKTSGMGRLIEGCLSDAPIVLIDDILNSASSAERARSALASVGHSIAAVFVIVDYHSRAGETWQARLGMEVLSLFALADFGLSLRPPSPPFPVRYKEVWRTGVAGGFPHYVVPKSAPVLVDSLLFRGCDAGIMHAFDAVTGQLRWAHQAAGASPRKGIWSTPAISEGRLYYGAYNGVVYALDAATGREVWAQPCCEWVGASPLVLAEHGLLLIGLEYERPWAQGALTALDLKAGAKVWEHLVTRFQHGSPAYWKGGDLVFWGSADHVMLALRPATGDIVWSFPTRRSVKYAPSVDEDRCLVAFASFDHSIYLLDAETGKMRGEWKTNDICYTTPLFAKGRLFCGSGDRHLYVVDLDTMRLERRMEFDARIYASPRLIGNSVVLATTGGRVIELDADTLEQVAEVRLPDAITNAVVGAADGRRLYVSTYMNHLFCLEREPNEEPISSDEPCPRIEPV